MWRKAAFEGSQDSDQSISEEEDLSPDRPENCITLGRTAEKEGGIPIQSQLEVLRDTHDVDHRTETSVLFNQRQTGFSSEDEVENPVFHDEGGIISSATMASTCILDEEIIFDDEENNVHFTLSNTSGVQNLDKTGHYSLAREKKDITCTWSGITKEADALVHLIENSRSSSSHAVSSNVNKIHKGGPGKTKSKFLFRSLSHKEDILWPANSLAGTSTSSKLLALPQELEAVDNRTKENSKAELPENFQRGKLERLEIYGAPTEVAVRHVHTKHSMAELLDSYQEMAGFPRKNLFDERTRSPSGERNIDNDDHSEALDSESSNDDDGIVQNLGLIIPESRQKTMTDKFQETFGGAAVNDQSPHFVLHGIGIFGKLRQVMQNEKKRDMDFLKQLQTGSSSKEASCIDVEILSKCLEAKLTVCCCSLSGDRESSLWTKSPHMAKENQRTLTIIFSSRVCDEVELEVGSLIRIHSPWKEIHAEEEDEVIILSAYFSQILS